MLLQNQMGSKLAMLSRKWVQNLLCAREMVSGNESRLDNIRWKCWVREVSLAVYACGERNLNSDSL